MQRSTQDDDNAGLMMVGIAVQDEGHSKSPHLNDEYDDGVLFVIVRRITTFQDPTLRGYASRIIGHGGE